MLYMSIVLPSRGKFWQEFNLANNICSNKMYQNLNSELDITLGYFNLLGCENAEIPSC